MTVILIDLTRFEDGGDMDALLGDNLTTSWSSQVNTRLWYLMAALGQQAD